MRFLAILFVVLFALPALAQDNGNGKDAKASKMQKGRERQAKEDFMNGQVLALTVIDGDTIPVTTLRTFSIINEREFKNKREKRQYGRLLKDIRKVYPYAKLAGERYRLYASQLEGVESKHKRKKHMKQVEKDLKAEFGDEIAKLNIRQGRILIRLIDRELGDTSYELVSELRGSFQAFFWQGVAKVFGHNLKSEYNPEEGEDEMIEDIIMRIDAGLISLEPEPKKKN